MLLQSTVGIEKSGHKLKIQHRGTANESIHCGRVDNGVLYLYTGRLLDYEHHASSFLAGITQCKKDAESKQWSMVDEKANSIQYQKCLDPALVPGLLFPPGLGVPTIITSALQTRKLVRNKLPRCSDHCAEACSAGDTT